jgi:uncharacterized membrane protein YfcA
MPIPPLVAPLVALAISALTAPAGVSGAFLLLPFQVSALGLAGPAASATNLVFNIIAAPGGVYGYARERRMVWPLAWTICLGTLPGVALGAIVRVKLLADPRSFKVFAGCVLLWLGARLLWQAARRGGEVRTPQGEVAVRRVSIRRIEYGFGKETYSFRPGPVLLLGLAVGLAGGVYGVGGGAMIAPFLVAAAGLPLYTVAGACLLATFVTSVAGVAAFWGALVQPDWTMGALFGVGGLVGTYVGARLQKHLPERWIRLALGALVTALAAGYIGPGVW